MKRQTGWQKLVLKHAKTILDVASTFLAWIKQQAKAKYLDDWLDHWKNLPKKPSSYVSLLRRRLDDVFTTGKRMATSQLLHQ